MSAIRWCALTLLTALAVGTVAAALVFADVALQREYAGTKLVGSVVAHLAALAGATLCGAWVCARLVYDHRNGRAAPASFLPHRLAFVIAVATLAVHFAYDMPYHPLKFVVLVGEGFGALALVLLAFPALTRATPGRALRAADVTLFTLAATAVLAEATLRVYATLRPSPLLSPDGFETERWLRAWQMKPGRIHNGFPCDSRGFYDDELTPDQRAGTLVVSIGDSFSSGIVPHPFHFTTVCERELSGVTVYNVGAPAADPRIYLHFAREVALPLEPDLLVVNVFIGNDLDWGGPTPGRDWNRWLSRDGLLLYVVPSRVAAIRTERLALGDAGHGIASPQSTERTLVGLSRDEIAVHMPWLTDPTLERATFSEEKFRGIEGARVQLVCDPSRTHFDVALDALAGIVEAARDVPVVFVLIPDEFQVEADVWRMAVPVHDEARYDRDYPQRFLRAWCEERGVACLDLLPILRAEPPLEGGRRHLYHLRDTHFNARGNEVAGKALARFLAPLIGRASAAPPLPTSESGR